MNSISIMLTDEEIEICYNLICDELEFLSMDFEKDPRNQLMALRKKLLQKRLFLLGDK